MTELFTKGDRVEMLLNSESASVPDGKIWVVSLMTSRWSDGHAEVVINGESGGGVVKSDSPDMDSTMSQITLHDDMAIDATDQVLVSGWQFSYDE